MSLQSLKGKRFTLINECPCEKIICYQNCEIDCVCHCKIHTDVLNESTIKQLTGGDRFIKKSL